MGLADRERAHWDEEEQSHQEILEKQDEQAIPKKSTKPCSKM